MTEHWLERMEREEKPLRDVLDHWSSDFPAGADRGMYTTWRDHVVHHIVMTLKAQPLTEKITRWRAEDPPWWATYDEYKATTRHCPDRSAHEKEMP